VKQEVLTLPENLSKTPVFSGIRVAGSLVCCVMLCIIIVCPIVDCLLSIFLRLRLLINLLIFSNFPFYDFVSFLDVQSLII
jgi:hypothetical protein